jgi:RNA repair pathway DNA polymerase beta family
MLIVKMQFGSHVYGTNLPTSDLDLKAVHVPDADDILLQRVKPAISITTKQDKKQRNGAADVDFESFALQKFMGMLLEGQTVALSMLFTPDEWIRESSAEWEEIKANKAKWLHRGVSAFAGYCRQQANKYGIKGSRVAASRAAMEFFAALIDLHGYQAKLREHWKAIEALVENGNEHLNVVEGLHGPGKSVLMLEVCNRKIQEHATLKEGFAVCKRIFDEYGQRALMAENDQGVDWKAMMHAVRVAREAEELLLHHRITYPRPEADLLKEIRTGARPYKEVAGMLESGLSRLEECIQLSSLPEKADSACAQDLIMKVYRAEVLGQYDA